MLWRWLLFLNIMNQPLLAFNFSCTVSSPLLALTELRRVRPLLRRRQWHPTPVFLPGKSHGGRSLVGCSPWGRKESDRTERLHFHFSLLCIGEGNGNPLQCSSLENPRDDGDWWAVVYGVAQSRTRLKRLSSSRSYWPISTLWINHFKSKINITFVNFEYLE